MVRKTVTALVMIALVLIGLQPLGAPVASPMAVAMNHEQPCCAGCDQPAVPDRGCPAMAGCMAVPPVTVPAFDAIPVLYVTVLAHPLWDQAVVPAADISPPFRPPRSLILA